MAEAPKQPYGSTGHLCVPSSTLHIRQETGEIDESGLQAVENFLSNATNPLELHGSHYGSSASSTDLVDRRQCCCCCAFENDSSDDDHNLHQNGWGQNHVRDLNETTFWQRNRLLIVLCVYSFLVNLGDELLKPVKPKLASETYAPDDHHRGPRIAAMVEGISMASAVSLAVFFSPLYAFAINVFGRKPFFVILAIVKILNNLCFVVFTNNAWVWTISEAISHMVTPGFIHAYICDKFPIDSHRTRAMGAQIAMTNLARVFAVIVVVDPVSEESLNLGLGIVGLAASVVALLIAIVVIKESLPRRVAPVCNENLAIEAQCTEEDAVLITKLDNITQAELQGRHKFKFWKLLGPWCWVVYLRRTWILFGALLILLITTFASKGLEVILYEYLEENLHYTKDHFAVLGLVEGSLSALTLFFVLPMLLERTKPVVVILLALLGLVVRLLVFASASEQHVDLASAQLRVLCLMGPFKSIEVLLVPTLMTLVANACRESHHGHRMVALDVCRETAIALGMLAFGVAYGLDQNEHPIYVTIIIVFALVGQCIVSFVISVWGTEFDSQRHRRKQRVLRPRDVNDKTTFRREYFASGHSAAYSLRRRRIDNVSQISKLYGQCIEFNPH